MHNINSVLVGLWNHLGGGARVVVLLMSLSYSNKERRSGTMVELVYMKQVSFPWDS